MVDATGAVARHCARFPTPWRLVGAAFGLDRVAPALCRPHFLSEWDHGSDREVDQVMGAFFLVRTAVFAELEGFDERFFVYFEDLDFARRARLRGWRSWYCAHARVFHAGGGTTGSIRGRRLHLVLRARLQYAVKHFSWAGTAAVFAATLLVEPWSRALHALRHRGRMGLRETLLGYRLLWSDLPVGRRARVPAR
jgi:GT2 family glycosyltransferase